MTYAANRQAKTENKAFERGQTDFRAGKTLGSNPYNPDRHLGLWRAWIEGWEDIADQDPEIGA